jgi:hypothetical protein
MLEPLVLEPAALGPAELEPAELELAELGPAELDPAELGLDLDPQAASTIAKTTATTVVTAERFIASPQYRFETHVGRTTIGRLTVG